MKVSEVIASGLLETYILGGATDEEVLMIRELCRKHPELITEIERVEARIIEASSHLNEPLNPGLKDKISAQLSFRANAAPPKIVDLQNTQLGFYKFGIAASLLLFVSSFFYILVLQQKLNRLNGEVAALSASKTYMAEELKIQQASLFTINSELRVVSDPSIKKIPLKGMNSLASSSAVIHWNPQTSEVYFNAALLPKPENKQYQLWAIVDGKPVDAGMINPEGDLIFQKMKAIASAQAFAVTIEKPGGSATPSMETMCLLGNV
ncbi:MAG: anti-sigma factor [Bacteroidota bacterium]